MGQRVGKHAMFIESENKILECKKIWENYNSSRKVNTLLFSVTLSPESYAR